MKQYAKQIEDAKAKIAELKAQGGRLYTASKIEEKLGKLTSAISKKDAAGAEKAAADLTGEAKSIEVPTVETTVKDSLSKKK